MLKLTVFPLFVLVFVWFLPLLFVWSPASLSIWSNGVAACVMFAWYPYMRLRLFRDHEYRCLSFGGKMRRLRHAAKATITVVLLPTFLVWLYMMSESVELWEQPQHQRTAAMFAAVWFGLELSALMMVTMPPIAVRERHPALIAGCGELARVCLFLLQCSVWPHQVGPFRVKVDRACGEARGGLLFASGATKLVVLLNDQV